MKWLQVGGSFLAIREIIRVLSPTTRETGLDSMAGHGY